MKPKQIKRQKIIIRIATLLLIMVAARLLRNCGGQFRWEYIPYTPMLFMILQAVAKESMPKMSDRVKLLFLSVAVAVFMQLLFDGFNLDVALYKTAPVLLGGLLTIPLLFVEALYRDSGLK